MMGNLAMSHLVLDLIDEVTRRSPDRVAVVHGDRSMTFGELDQQARTLAAELVSRGVGRERLVCVAVEPSPWAVLAMVAVLRTGAAYVPLDPGYPRARLQDMLEQVGALGAPLVLTTSTAAPKLPAH